MTDKPRRIISCNPDVYPEIQEAVTSDFDDVLVVRSKFVPEGTIYVMNPSVFEDILNFEADPFPFPDWPSFNG